MNTPPTPTPRTDAEGTALIPIAFARTLETELAAANAHADSLAEALGIALCCNQQSREERRECEEALTAHDARKGGAV